MRLTLLGFSDVSTIILTEIAAAQLGVNPDAMMIEIVCNLPFNAKEMRKTWPLPHSNLTILSKDSWEPANRESIIMPGLMTASVCQQMVEDFEESTSTRREDFGVMIHPSANRCSFGNNQGRNLDTPQRMCFKHDHAWPLRQH